jgi:hypothetical protein
MKKYQIIEKLLSAFDTHSKGFSARKLSAFVIILCVVAIHIGWLKYAFRTENFSLMEGLLMIDYAFIAACLGMTTYETIQKIKNKPDGKNTDTPPATDVPAAGGDAP